MPEIYEYFGLIFRFYSEEHEPIHVHVEKGGCETVFDIIIAHGELLEVRARKGKRRPLPEKDEATAIKFVKANYKKIVERWVNYFILHKSVRKIRITKRI